MNPKTLTAADLENLVATAKNSARQRSHHNLHEALDAKVQRLAIAMEPDTYVAPHRHPQTWELYIALTGTFKVITFDGDGSIRACCELGTQIRAFELPANVWHSVIALEPGSVIFEVKEGPYIKPVGVDVPAWAPAEGTADAPEFFRFLQDCAPGMKF